MTKQLTRQEVEEIMISFLHKKWHKVGEPKPIYIGTVLGKTSNTENDVQRNYDRLKLCDLWQPLGFSRSLQEICEASGWEEKYQKIADMDVSYGVLFSDKDGFGECRVCGANMYHASDCSLKIERKKEVGILTSPEANALCEYLLSLFPIPNE